MEAKIVKIQTQNPGIWQGVKQKVRNLPKNLQDRDLLLEALREGGITLVTDLADNTVLNTLVAIVGPLLSDPD